MINLPSLSTEIASKVDLTPFVISYVEILILPSSRVSISTPSIAVIVPLLETVPIAGVSLFINVDLDTVNLIFVLSPRTKAEDLENVFILMVGVVVVGTVENVGNFPKP